MPRAVFEEVLRELSAHPPFADKDLGHNKAKWGTPSHPLRYKLAAAIYYLVDGCTMKRACERCHLDSDGRWRLTFHKYMAYLQEPSKNLPAQNTHREGIRESKPEPCEQTAAQTGRCAARGAKGVP